MIRHYEGYKPSGNTWLGDIPSAWSLLRAKYIFREVDDRSVCGEEELLSVSHLTGVTPRSEKNVTMFMSEDYTGAKLCRNGDLVINTMWAWMGALGVSSCKGIVSPAYGVYRQLGDQLLPRYADWLLRTPTYVAEYTRRSTGVNSSRLRLYPDSFLDLPVLVPSKEDQVKIANFLDSKAREIDVAISMKEKLIEMLKEQKKILIAQTVAHGLNPAAIRKDSDVEWIGKVPAHWEIKRLKHLTNIKRGASPRPIDDPRYFADDGEYAWVRISDVSSSGMYLQRTTQRLSKAGSSRSLKREPGDLFLSIAGSVGKAIITNIKCCIHDGFVAFENPTISREYLYFLFASEAPFVGLGKHGTQLNLNTSFVGNVCVPVPPAEEVREIVTFLKSATSIFDASISAQLRQIAHLVELRSATIALAVLGKIKV